MRQARIGIFVEIYGRWERVGHSLREHVTENGKKGEHLDFKFLLDLSTLSMGKDFEMEAVFFCQFIGIEG